MSEWKNHLTASECLEIVQIEKERAALRQRLKDLRQSHSKLLWRATARAVKAK